MNGLTIMFISHEATLTGAPLLLREVIRHLKRTLDITAIIVIRADVAGSPLRADFEELGEVISGWEPITWPAHVDLIYSNTCTNGLFLEGLPYGTVPVLTHVHEMTESILTFGRNNWEAILRHTSVFLASSSPVQLHLLHNFHIPDDQVYMARPFCSPARIDYARTQSTPAQDELLRSLNGAFVIGGSGAATFRKGADFLARLSARVPDQIAGKAVRFAWVGANMERFLERVPPSRRERWILFGEHRNPFPIFCRFDVFAVTSREDPGPMVMLESAYLEVPVIGFAGTGSIDELAAAGGGLAIPPLNEDRFLAQVMILAHNPALRARIAARGKQVVLEQFTDVVCLEQIATAVRGALGASRPPIHRELSDTDVWHAGMIARVREAAAGFFHIYYAGGINGSTVTHYDRTLPAAIDIPVEVASPSLLLRVDPDVAPGIFTIRHLVLTRPCGREILRLGVSHPWSCVTTGGSTMILSTSGELALLSYGEDPQIFLPPLDIAEPEILRLSVQMTSDCSSAEFGRALQKSITPLQNSV